LNLPDVAVEGLRGAFDYGITRSSWSPNGRYLAFAGQMHGLSSDLYRYDTVSQTILQLSTGPQEILWMSWSPDGNWIVDGSSYIITEESLNDIYATAMDGSSVHLLARDSDFFLESPKDWFNPHTYYEYDSKTGVGSYNLHLRDIITGDSVEIWPGSFFDIPAIDPQKEWIAFCSPAVPTDLNGSLATGPYNLNLKAGKFIPVKVPNDLYGATLIQTLGFSKDRMFVLVDNNWNLFYLSTQGTISPANITAYNFSLSPNGQYFITMSDKLQVFKADGTHIRDIDLPADLEGNANYCSCGIIWRPDSSGIFFYDENFGNSNPPGESYTLDAMDLLNGSLRPVDVFSPASVYSISPDFIWENNIK
jgi:WD40 repeat protein